MDWLRAPRVEAAHLHHVEGQAVVPFIRVQLQCESAILLQEGALVDRVQSARLGEPIDAERREWAVRRVLENLRGAQAEQN